jgi:hypothetical protein
MGFIHMDMVLILTLATTYFLFISVGGFSDIIQKCLKVKGNVNLLINTILFMMLIRVVVDNVPKYMKLIKVIYNRYLGRRPLQEGQSEKGNLAQDTLKKRISNLEELVSTNYEKHDTLSDGPDKDKLLVKIRKYQTDIDDLSRTMATLSTSR